MSETLTQDLHKKMKEVLAQAQKGSKRVRFTFHSTSISQIPFLLALDRGGVVKLEPADNATLFAVNTGRNWGPDANRKVEIELPLAFDADQFVARMAPACQSIVAL
jgi:hypothetical protein